MATLYGWTYFTIPYSALWQKLRDCLSSELKGMNLCIAPFQCNLDTYNLVQYKGTLYLKKQTLKKDSPSYRKALGFFVSIHLNGFHSITTIVKGLALLKGGGRVIHSKTLACYDIQYK